jgi:hypothetical protein
MKQQSVSDVCGMLEGLGEVWIYLSEYRITHGHLHLLVTDKNFSRLADVYFSDCLYISGPTSGGPWKVSVAEEAGDDGKRIVLYTEGRALTIRALRIYAERVHA